MHRPKVETADRFPREAGPRRSHLCSMKRRHFLNLTAGSAFAAVAPLPQLAAAAPAAMAPRNLYVWAVAMAHAGNPISTDTLGSALKVTPDQAAALIQKLVTRGVVGAPNAVGVARAATPVFKSAGLVPEPATSVIHTTRKTSADVGQDWVSKASDTIEKSETVSGESVPMSSTDDPEPPEVSNAAHSTE